MMKTKTINKSYQVQQLYTFVLLTLYLENYKALAIHLHIYSFVPQLLTTEAELKGRAMESDKSFKFCVCPSVKCK